MAALLLGVGAAVLSESVQVSVGSDVQAETGSQFACMNIDASRNREFFERNLSTTRGSASVGSRLSLLTRSVAQAQPTGTWMMRFGGSGNDYLTYEFGGTECPERSSTQECLNETQWRDLLEFTEASSGNMIFGLSMNTGADFAQKGPGFPFPWDPSNARQILNWTIAQKKSHLIWGFTLGNEQNNKYTGDQIAENYAILFNLTKELWPDASSRPRLIGPDPHSLHTSDISKPVSWLEHFLDGCQKRGVPVFAASHHEYVEVPQDGESAVSTKLLGDNSGIGKAWAKAVSKYPGVLPMGSEIGPHNGGDAPCDHTSMRWANFGDSLWYADDLGAKASHGYYMFCRQNLIGIDYGMTDCSTGLPLPDFYTALLWATHMGEKVLGAESSEDTVRSYAHCARSSSDGAVTVLLVNVGENSTEVEVSGVGSGDYYTHTLTASDKPGLTNKTGLAGTAAEFNGKVLEFSDTTGVPDMGGVKGKGDKVTVPGHSVTYVVFKEAGAAACKA